MGGPIDAPADTPADKNAQRGGDRQIDPHGEGQRGDAAEFEHQGDHHPDEHQVPGELPIEHALNDVAHQHRLRGIVLGDRGPAGQLRFGSGDGRIHQPDGLARIIDQPFPRHAIGIGLMPHAVFLGIQPGHRTHQVSPRRIGQGLGRSDQARGNLRGAHMNGPGIVHG